MSDDLGPFAIRRIEPGASPGVPAVTSAAEQPPTASVLTRAVEAFGDRVTGAVERDSADDSQIAEAIRAQSAAIGADALTPLLGWLSAPPALSPVDRMPDAPAPAPDTSRASTHPSVDPSADAMRTSVFYPLSDLASTPATGGDAGARTVGSTHDRSERLRPLLDPFLPVTPRTRDGSTD